MGINAGWNAGLGVALCCAAAMAEDLALSHRRVAKFSSFGLPVKAVALLVLLKKKQFDCYFLRATGQQA